MEHLSKKKLKDRGEKSTLYSRNNKVKSDMLSSKLLGKVPLKSGAKVSNERVFFSRNKSLAHDCYSNTAALTETTEPTLLERFHSGCVRCDPNTMTLVWSDDQESTVFSDIWRFFSYGGNACWANESVVQTQMIQASERTQSTRQRTLKPENRLNNSFLKNPNSVAYKASPKSKCVNVVSVPRIVGIVPEINC